jgi:hypothetical protein
MMAMYGRNMSFRYYYQEYTSFIQYELCFDHHPTHLYYILAYKFCATKFSKIFKYAHEHF